MDVTCINVELPDTEVQQHKGTYEIFLIHNRKNIFNLSHCCFLCTFKGLLYFLKILNKNIKCLFACDGPNTGQKMDELKRHTTVWRVLYYYTFLHFLLKQDDAHIRKLKLLEKCTSCNYDTVVVFTSYSTYISNRT